jgi:hypothetical protein
MQKFCQCFLAAHLVLKFFFMVYTDFEGVPRAITNPTGFRGFVATCAITASLFALY